MTDAEIIEVVKAHMEGKKIQCIGINEADKDINWTDDDDPKWNFWHLRYRVAPEPRKPREWWICPNPKPEGFDYAYPSGRYPLIRVREVLDERQDFDWSKVE